VKTWEGNDYIAAANENLRISFSPDKDGFEIKDFEVITEVPAVGDFLEE
jgi:hypothetical protein